VTSVINTENLHL